MQQLVVALQSEPVLVELLLLFLDFYVGVDGPLVFALLIVMEAA